MSTLVQLFIQVDAYLILMNRFQVGDEILHALVVGLDSYQYESDGDF